MAASESEPSSGRLFDSRPTGAVESPSSPPERALQDSEQRLRWALQAARGGAWDWDLEEDRAWWSDEMYDLWGVEPGTAMNLENSVALVLEADRSRLQESVDRALARGGDFHFEFRIRHPTRGERWMASHGHLLVDESQKPVRMIGVTLDVTERRGAVEALGDRDRELRAILNTAVDAIITIDERGIITGVNPATGRMFGYSESELIGRNVNILMPPPFRQEHDRYVSNYLRTGVAKIIGIGREVVARRKDGSTFPIDLAVSEFHDGHGRMFTGILRDISERKRLEQHLAESRVEERRNLAQEIHDGLGGLMTGIGMLAKTLQLRLQNAGRVEADAAADLVRHVRDAHEHLRRIARGLLPVEVTPSGLRTALENLARGTDGGDRLACEFECQGDVEVRSPADATHLFRIAQEAVTNAVRHGRPTRITIGLRQESEHLTVTVRDNGAGIQESSYAPEGMGLRTMVHRANQIGAILAVQSVEGGGTVVVCNYPHRSRRD